MNSEEQNFKDKESSENEQSEEQEKKKKTTNKVDKEEEKNTEEESNNSNDSEKEKKRDSEGNESGSDISDFCYQNKFRFKTNSIELQKKIILKSKLKDKPDGSTDVPSSQKGKKASDNTIHLINTEDSSVTSNKEEQKTETINEKAIKKDNKSKKDKKSKFDTNIKSEREIKLEKKIKNEKKSSKDRKHKGDIVCLKTNEYDAHNTDSIKKNKIKENKKRESNVECHRIDSNEHPKDENTNEEQCEMEETDNEMDSKEKDLEQKKQNYLNLREAEMKINEKLKMIHMLKKEKMKCSELSPLDMIKQHGKLVNKIDQICNNNHEEISFLKNELTNLKDEVHKLMNIVNMSQKVVNALK